MKYIFSVLLILPLFIHAQNTDSSEFQPEDSLIFRRLPAYMVLVCEPKHSSRSALRIRSGEKIRVSTAPGVKLFGVLQILSKDSFEMTRRNGQKDTFSVSEIHKIKKTSLGRQIGGSVVCATGWAGIIWGTGLMSTPYYNDPYGLKFLGGFALLLVSVPIEILGAHITKGKAYRKRAYTFKIA
jgi:hypothetical protein